MKRPTADARGGFTLVEILIALTILTVGVLGLAGTTAVAVRQVTLSRTMTDRSAALQAVVERLRALPYDSLADGADTLDDFRATWSVTSSSRSKAVQIITIGPGLARRSGSVPGLERVAADTFVYRIARP